MTMRDYMRLRYIAVVAVPVLLAMMASLAPAQRQLPTTRLPLAKGTAVGFEGLSFKIEAEQSQYTLGEPIVVYETLTNQGNRAVGVMEDLAPETGYVRFRITGPGRTDADFHPPMATCSDAPPVLLKPGESITDSAKLFLDSKGWVFARPGSYRVRASYFNRVQSNELVLNIVQGKSAADQSAATILLGSPQAQKFLYLEGGDHLSRGRSDLERISNQAGSPVLAGYANFALGTNLSEGFANFTTGRLRPADLPSANRYLEKSVQTLPGSLYFSVGLLGQLNKNYTTLRRTNEANAVATQMQTLVRTKFPTLAPAANQLLLRRAVPLTLQIRGPG